MRNVTLRLGGFVLSLALLTGAASSAVAGDKDMALHVEGFVETSYIFNLQDPPGGENANYPYLSQHNTFDIGNAHIAASGSTGDASVVVEVDAGNVAMWWTAEPPSIFKRHMRPTPSTTRSASLPASSSPSRASTSSSRPTIP